MRVLFLASHDLRRYRHSRFKRLVRHLGPHFPGSVVIYRVHPVGERARWSREALFRLGVERWREGGLLHLGLDPWLNYPLHAGARLTGTNPYARPPRRRRLVAALLGTLGTARWWAVLASLAALWRRELAGQRFEVALAQGVMEGLFALWLRRQGAVRRVVYDDHDYEAGFVTTSPLAHALMRRLENRALVGADLVVSVGEMLAEKRRRELGLSPLVVENGVELALFRPPGDLEGPLRRVVYAGFVGGWSGLDLLARAVRRLPPDRRPEVVVLGHEDPVFRRELERLASGLPFRLLGPRPHQELPAHFARAQVGWALFRPIPLRRYAFSMKVLEYMACGLAVLTTEGTQAARTVGKAGLALPYEAEAVARALSGLGEAELAGLRARAVRQAQGYDWEQLLARYRRALSAELPGSGPEGNLN